MKQIKNTSLQGRFVFLHTPVGNKECWLAPGKALVVTESSITKQVRTLVSRKLLKIQNA